MELSRKVRHLLLLSTSAFCLAFFIYLSTEVQEASLGLPELIGRIDRAAGELMGAIRNPLLTSVVIAITHLGSGYFLTVLVVLVALFWSYKRVFRPAVLLVASGISASIASAFLKSHYARARPELLDHLVQAGGFSFPSGHTLAATTVYLTLAILLAQHIHQRRIRFAILTFVIFLILAIGLSRIYLGVHYFSDVLGGVCIGVSIASLVGAIRRQSEEGVGGIDVQ